MRTLRWLLKGIAVGLGLFIIRTMFAAFVAWMIGIPMIALATAERGHPDAYGGEWMVIGAAFILTFWLASKYTRFFIPQPEKEEKASEQLHLHQWQQNRADD